MENFVRMLLPGHDKAVTAQFFSEKPIVFPDTGRIVIAVEPKIEAPVDPAGYAAQAVGKEMTRPAHSRSRP